jgi:hypothetical protein
MNSLLLIIEVPKTETLDARVPHEEALMSLSKALSAIASRLEGIEEIPPNVWRLTTPNGLSFLRNALVLAGDQKLPCRILPISDEPQWICGIPLP